jgi:dienelactone hydrolase
MKTHALLLALATPLLAADAPRVTPQGQLPNDVRLQPLKDLDGYFPWSPPASPDAWKVRAEQVRTQMRIAMGIFPEPTKTPLNAVVHGKVEREDFTVERVFFESMPGFYVTGSLFRPKTPGRHPAVLCPHGHWANGRFYTNAEANVKKDIEKGAEALLENGSVPLQARCVTLARMGCVVFHFDMLGNADSVQIPADVVHGFKKQRPEAIAAKDWALFSPQAESHAQSIMGLQTWNAIRALDFVQSLPDVDSTRIGVTGASGGGTQTFILSALDPRVTVSAPCVMVSTAMQGGCTCENASLLRVGTGNIEFAALFAPKPLHLTTADDWTKEMATKGYPELSAHWSAMGVPGKIKMHDRTEFPHNYNLPSRLAVYAFLNEHLGLGAKVEERGFKPLSKDELTVWGGAHPAPSGDATGIAFERKLCAWWTADAAKQIAAGGEKITRPAVEAIFQRTLAGEKAIMDHSTFKKEQRGDFLVMTGLVENEARKEALPALFIHPKKWNGRTVVVLTEKGKAGLLAADGQPTGDVQRIIASGASVMGVDLLMQGEFLFSGQSDAPARKVKNPREAAAYTHGYNHSLFAQRTHDVLSVLAFIRDHAEHKTTHVSLVALDATAPIAIAARALADGYVNVLAVDTKGFRFGKVNDNRDPFFQPAIAKYGDLPGLIALGKGAQLALGENNQQPLDAFTWVLAQ